MAKISMLLAAISILFIQLASLTPSAPKGEVAFESDFSGMWGTESEMFSTTPNPSGTYDIVNGALNIRVTKEQDEAGGNHHTEIKTLPGIYTEFGETYLFSFSVFFEDWSYDTNWDIISQWWSRNEFGEPSKNPSMAFVIHEGRMFLKVKGDIKPITNKQLYGYDRDSRIDLGAVESNVWIDWDFKVRFDPFGNGELSIWKNGELIYEECGTQIGYNDHQAPDWRLGIYKRYYLGSDVEERSIFFDNVKIIYSAHSCNGNQG